MDITEEELRRRFTNQPPRTPPVATVFDELTELTIAYGSHLIERVPAGREKSLMVTHLEEVLMWAKKGAALNQGAIDPEAAADA